MILITCFLILLNAFLFSNYTKFSKKFNLLDYPENLRKIHSKPTPYVGGIFIFLNLFILFFISYFIIGTSSEILLNFKFLIFCFALFILGLIDDKNNLNPFLKIIILTTIIFIFLKLDQSGILSELRFSFTNKILFLGNFSIFISVLCYLIFINALNFFDGLDLQAGLYIIFIFIILIFISFDSLLIFLLIPLMFFIYYNFNGKMFLGNNGSHFFGFLISYLFIYSYNLENILFTDQVVLLMIVPGMDMLRLFVVRLINKKHPFFPDNNHMHHILINKLGKLYYFITLIFLIIIPNLLYLYGINFWLLMIFIIFLYSYYIFFYKKKFEN